MSILSCLICSASLTGQQKAYCSGPCKNRAKYEREKASGYADVKNRRRHKAWSEHLALTARPLCTATGCDRPHTAKGFCLMHWKADKRRNGATWAVSGSDFKRRALQYGAEYERFDKRDIFARDGWACQLCSLPVDRGAKFPHPQSPSLDHIVPLSLGGDHVPSNTQCTHLGCNMRKSNNMEVADGAKVR